MGFSFSISTTTPSFRSDPHETRSHDHRPSRARSTHPPAGHLHLGFVLLALMAFGHKTEYGTNLACGPRLPAAAAERVGVEMTIADHPIQNFRRAALPHRAPALGDGAESLRRPGIAGSHETSRLPCKVIRSVLGVSNRAEFAELAMAMRSVWPSALSSLISRHSGRPRAHARGHGLRSSIPGLHPTLSTLRHCPRGQQRMTLGSTQLAIPFIVWNFTISPCRL